MNITALGSILGVIATIAGGFFAADSHWARASDVTALSRSIEVQAGSIAKQIEINRLSGEANTLELRRASVLDKLQDAAARKSLSPPERAIVQRYDNDLKYVEETLRDKQRQIDQLRKP